MTAGGAAPSRCRGVVGTAEAVRGGALSPSDLADDALQRLDEVGHLRAFSQRFAEPGGTRGPLAGVPVSVKDNIDVRGRVTGLGRPLDERPAAAGDAAVVARLRAAGATILGKTTLSEFACSAITRNAVDGATRNPADPRRTPGGSSGGSAAAVAAGVTPASLGTDTGGSVLVPAALTGVFGYRPTHGTVDPSGVFPSAPSLDTVGAFASDAEGLAVLGRVLSGAPEPAPPPGPPRIGVLSGWWEPCEPAVRDAVAAALDELGVRITVPVTVDDLDAATGPARTLYLQEVARSLRGLPDTRVPYAPAVDHRRTAGASVTAADLDAARAARRAWRGRLREMFRHVDVVVCPAAPAIAPLLSDVEDSNGLDLVRFAYPFCLAGVPAVTVPVANLPVATDGRPVGLLMVADRHRDDTVLDAARRVTGALRRPHSTDRMHPTRRNP